MASESTSKPQEAKITLHWMNASRSHRILWLLEELNVKYDLKVYHRQKTKMAPEELKHLHPLGKAPLLTIEAPGAEPFVLAESGAIVEYLIDHYGEHIKPKRYKDGKDGQVGGETEAWIRDRYLMHFAEGTLMPYLVMTMIVDNLRNAPFPFKLITKPIGNKIGEFVDPNVQKNFELVEKMLETAPDKGPWLTGNQPRGSDFMLCYPMQALLESGMPTDAYPRICEYVKLVEERPAYKKAVQKIVDTDGKFEGNIPT